MTSCIKNCMMWCRTLSCCSVTPEPWWWMNGKACAFSMSATYNWALRKRLCAYTCVAIAILQFIWSFILLIFLSRTFHEGSQSDLSWVMFWVTFAINIWRHISVNQRESLLYFSITRNVVMKWKTDSENLICSISERWNMNKRKIFFHSMMAKNYGYFAARFLKICALAGVSVYKTRADCENSRDY